MIIDPIGAIIGEAGDQPAVITGEVELDAIEAWRRKFPALRDGRRSLLGSIDVAPAADPAD